MKQFYGFGRSANVNLSLVKRSVGILMAMALLLVFLPFAHAQTEGYSLRHRAGSFRSCDTRSASHTDQRSHKRYTTGDQQRHGLFRVPISSSGHLFRQGNDEGLCRQRNYWDCVARR